MTLWRVTFSFQRGDKRDEMNTYVHAESADDVSELLGTKYNEAQIEFMAEVDGPRIVGSWMG